MLRHRRVKRRGELVGRSQEFWSGEVRSQSMTLFTAIQAWFRQPASPVAHAIV